MSRTTPASVRARLLKSRATSTSEPDQKISGSRQRKSLILILPLTLTLPLTSNEPDRHQRSDHLTRLQPPQARIDTITRQQLLVRTGFNNSTLVHYMDRIGMPHRAQAVRYQQQ